MEGKKNLCAMIPAELHAKIMAEKEQLELNTLAEYVERIFTEHFEGGQISMKAERTLAVQIPAEEVKESYSPNPTKKHGETEAIPPKQLCRPRNGSDLSHNKLHARNCHTVM